MVLLLHGLYSAPSVEYAFARQVLTSPSLSRLCVRLLPTDYSAYICESIHILYGISLHFYVRFVAPISEYQCLCFINIDGESVFFASS